MEDRDCLNCGKKLSKKNKSGYCNICRDRSGVNNPFYGKHHTKDTIERTKEKLRIISLDLWTDDEYREKVIKGVSKPRRDRFKQEQSERITQWYADNPEQKEIRSFQMKRSWDEGKIEPNINSINESKDEIKLRKLLVEELPNHKIAKKTLKLGGKWYYPDIIIDNKIIVEFFGNYWHANPKQYKEDDIIHHKKTANEIWESDRKRFEVFQNEGYIVFTVWQDDFKNNQEQVINSISQMVSL